MFADTEGLLELGEDEKGFRVGGPLASYDDGYECGLTWPDIWETHGKPGGPYVFSYGPCFNCRSPRTGCDRQTSPRFTCRQAIEYAARSREANRLWRLGWERGHQEKLRTGRRNPPRS